MIDEAHLLSPEQLEELRLLSSADMDSSSPFAGSSSVSQPCRLDSARSVRGLGPADLSPLRVAGMDLAESVAYLRHHIELAGRPTRSSPTMRPRGCTATPTHPPCPQQRSSVCAHGCRADGKASLTTSARRKQWPSSHATEQARVARAPIGVTMPPVAPSRVLTQSCRTVLTQ